VIFDQGPGAGAPIASRGAFEIAIAQGADFIGAELVTTSDGVLIARPDNELGGSTNVAQHPEFSDRHKTKTVHNVAISGWFSEDFTLAEIKTLYCLEENSAGGRRSGPGAPILTFQEVVDIARAGSIRTARVIGLWVGLRHPAYFAANDLPLEPRVAEAIRFNGYDSSAAAMLVSASESDSLRTLADLTKARRVQRLPGGTSSLARSDESEEARSQDLRTIHSYAAAICPDAEWAAATPTAARTAGLSPRVADAHAAGLAVYARADPPPGETSRQRRLMQSLLLAGCDGIVCRSIVEAVKARRDAEGHLGYGAPG
jgi:glycerophosphoryl diester phosphodiesterase